MPVCQKYKEFRQFYASTYLFFTQNFSVLHSTRQYFVICSSTFLRQQNFVLQRTTPRCCNPLPWVQFEELFPIGATKANHQPPTPPNPTPDTKDFRENSLYDASDCFFMIDNVKFARLQQPSNFSQFSDTLWITFLQPDKSYHSICLQNLIRFKNNRRQVRFAPNMTSRHPIPPNALPPKKHVQSFENDLTCSTEKQNWVFENFYWRHWKKSYGMGKVPRLPDQNCKIEAWYCKKHDVIFFLPGRLSYITSSATPAACANYLTPCCESSFCMRRECRRLQARQAEFGNTRQILFLW